MSTEMEKICPNCFKTEYEKNACRSCGYVESNPVKGTLLPLPSGCILQGRYIVGRVLGEGGFGVTYKAMDIEDGRICAIKEYAPLSSACRLPNMLTMSAVNSKEKSSYEDGVRNFLEEATVLHSLEEIPAVVRIMNSFLENGTAYFVMEYLDGSTLNKVLRLTRNRLSTETVTRIISTIGLAMHMVHEKTKILHRDISPENIYILKDETVKLIDFGSAKRLQNREKKGGCVFLKPNFAPPEQYDFTSLQGSYTDVYALACTYYYALSGKLLPSAQERQKSGKQYVPLKDMGLGVSAVVSDAVDQALHLDAPRRTQTMLAFVTAINPYISETAASRTDNAVRADKMACAEPAKPSPSLPPPPPPMKAPMAAFPYLKVEQGQNAGRKYTIKPGALIKLGRLFECDLCFDKQSEISKIHCYVYFDKEKNCFFVKDENSTNGTFIQGKRVMKNILTRADIGNRILLGSNQCIVELGADIK